MDKRNWTKPTIVVLNNNINSGGTGTSFVEYLTTCSSGLNMLIDQFVNYPGNTAVISGGGTGSTAVAGAGVCS